MKHEAEFKTFLTTQKRSAKTGKPYSVKVAGDVASRCRLVERLFGIEFSERTLTQDEADRLCERIKTVGTPVQPQQQPGQVQDEINVAHGGNP